MRNDDLEVIIVGGGAAGIAAAHRLRQAGIRCLIVEARARLGGRAWTVIDQTGYALDLGCGWLHSADRNPWLGVAERAGLSIDRTPPPWTRPSLEIGFSGAEQDAFQEAMAAFFAHLAEAATADADVAAATLLDPGSRWNGLIDTVGTFISGADLDRLSVKDFDRYEDSGVNFRVIEGYGTAICGLAAKLPVAFDCVVRRIDHSGRRLRLETSQGAMTCDRVIVTVPSAILAAERLEFRPVLAEKIHAAAGLPLGLADKLFIALDEAEEFPRETRLFGRTDRAGAGAYHLRPFGRPQIEAYFGGRFAAELEAGGDRAFFDCAVAELTGLFGTSFARRIRPIRINRWGADPFALGSYSFALPGFADGRQILAEPVDQRLFFAGEACSLTDFSTAHGAFETGVAAAEKIIALRRQPGDSNPQAPRPDL